MGRHLGERRGEIAQGEAQKGQAVIVREGTIPGDDGHSRANCEAVHKLASSIGDPIGSARGSGVVFVPQVEAPRGSKPPDFSYRTVGFSVLPQRRPDGPVKDKSAFMGSLGCLRVSPARLGDGTSFCWRFTSRWTG